MLPGEGRDSAAELISTPRRRLEVEEEGVRLRVMWQQSQGEWGRVLCGLPRFYLSAQYCGWQKSPGREPLPVLNGPTYVAWISRTG